MNAVEATPAPTLREQQAEVTRERIMSAMADLITTEHPSEISIDAVAGAAGVAQRTVFRHFPNREALLNGFASWVHRRLHTDDDPAQPTSPAALARATRVYFPRFEVNGAILRAIRSIRLSRELAERRRESRKQYIATAVESLTHDLDEADATRVRAVLHLLASSDAFFSMQDNYGLDSHEAAEAVVWAIDTLADRVKRTKRARGSA